MTKNIQNERYYLLDIFRGIAALCVVLQHYQHFFYVKPGLVASNFIYTEQPFFYIISPFYKFGSVAVHFFFILSGFIFFAIYRDKIFKNEINFKKFLILRISRLYPLHLLLLILTLLLQKVFLILYSEYYVYSDNSLINFILHFFLIQEWGFANLFNFETSAGFNYPAWSVSVEFLAYIIFFIISLFYAKNIVQTFIVIILIFFIYIFFHQNLALILLGILLFFLGGLTFFISLKIIQTLEKKKKIVVFVMVLFNIIVFGRFLNDFFLDFQRSVSFLIGDRFMILLFLIKFPLLIINLRIIQYFFCTLGKKFLLIGELSYTIYLIHFPIQIILMILSKQFLTLNFNSELFFICYFILIFISSFLIYKFFELPLKLFVRNKYNN